MGLCADAGGRRGSVVRHFGPGRMARNNHSDSQWACIALDSATSYVGLFEEFRAGECDQEPKCRMQDIHNKINGTSRTRSHGKIMVRSQANVISVSECNRCELYGRAGTTACSRLQLAAFEFDLTADKFTIDNASRKYWLHVYCSRRTLRSFKIKHYSQI